MSISNGLDFLCYLARELFKMVNRKIFYFALIILISFKSEYISGEVCFEREILSTKVFPVKLEEWLPKIIPSIFIKGNK